MNEINEAIAVLNENAEKSKGDISGFYNEIRKALDERENLLKFKIMDQLQKEEATLKNKEKSLYEHIVKIKNFYKEYEKSAGLSEINLLESCLQRQEIIFKATGQIERVDVILPFNELNKENELNYICKIFGSHKNNNNITKELAFQKNKNISNVNNNQIAKNGIPNSNANNTYFTKKKNFIFNGNHSKDMKKFKIKTKIFLILFK